MTKIIYRLLAKPFFQKRVTHILYNSKRAESEHILRGFSREKSQTIPNGFLLEKFAPSLDNRTRFRKHYGLAEDVIVIGTIARNHREKNYLGLLESIHQFYALSQVKTQFVFIGKGVVEDQEIQAAILRYQLQGEVLCLPEQREIHTVYPAFDFFVLPSFREGFSNVLAEAMLCGVPCIATDVGDSRFIVGDCGWVIDHFTVEGLAQALLVASVLPLDVRERYSTPARERIVDNFCIKKIGRQYDMLLM